MKIGLVDVDSHNFPNLPLMKLSAWHKAQGDTVEFLSNCFEHYDKVYVSKVFGDEYSQMDMTCINADEIVYGGTGFAITVENGKEVYHKDRDKDLPYEVEHIYPDYSLYPELTKNKAYGFLTRGCPNNCDFCIVSKKESRCSHKVADLSEWWDGQKEIILLDANILACKDRMDLLRQLRDSGARVEFSQGLDARLITVEVAEMLNQIKTSMVHFAFDFMRNEEKISEGLKIYKEICKPNPRNAIVYMLTNYNTTFAEDWYRICAIREAGFSPDVRIYRKESLPKRHILRDLQRWCNNRFLFNSIDFWDYKPRVNEGTMKEAYRDEYDRRADC
jgi:hypothetical protein